LTARQGITREQANEIIKQILAQYEDQLAEAPIGKRLDQCYNLETLEPTQEYVELYGRVKEKLSKFGLDYSLLGSSRK
jgi:methylamine--corrinoid protein Co-methyltransferase